MKLRCINPASHIARALIEAAINSAPGIHAMSADRLACRFVIQVPTVAQLKLTHELGTHSLASEPDKLTRAGAELFEIDEYDQPFVAGCSAWLACKLITEPHNQQTYDLFIGEIVG